jgi:hypothetical protein
MALPASSEASSPQSYPQAQETGPASIARPCVTLATCGARRSRARVPGFKGIMSDTPLMQRSPCPVLIVPPGETR